METKPCLECGQNFHKSHDAETRKAKFCSNTCKLAYQRLHPTNPKKPRLALHCETCGQAFDELPSQVNRRGRGKYCSRKCFGIGHSKTMAGRVYLGKRKGTKEGTYSSTASFRTVVRQQLPQVCMICGWDEATCDVCHIIARKNGGEDIKDNIVILCPNHHRMFDSGKLSLKKVMQARHKALSSLSEAQRASVDQVIEQLELC